MNFAVAGLLIGLAILAICGVGWRFLNSRFWRNNRERPWARALVCIPYLLFVGGVVFDGDFRVRAAFGVAAIACGITFGSFIYFRRKERAR